ncbi:acyl-CoA/acyl-ACP dehydrogenase [Porticoccaceae bacterium]|nr:acyl-CoA/acyl-ACP dehydrogenase [Porticoccaceae bacterium]
MVLNEEQRLLHSTIRDFLSQRAPVAALRELRDNGNPQGFDSDLWNELIELGVSSIVLSEEQGGLGFGWMGLGAVMEEIGRHLTATPMLSSIVIGAALVEAAADHHSNDLLPDVVVGTRNLAFACDEGLRYNPGATAAALDNGLLQGEKTFVINGPGATDFLVLARTVADSKGTDGLTLIVVPRDTAGVTVNPIHSADGHSFARVNFNQVAVDQQQIVGVPDRAWDFVSPVLDRATLALAAEMLGGARELLERTLAYLNDREQFDVKIGSFQALQHRCAQLFCQLELAQSVVYKGLSAIDQGQQDLAKLASHAKVLAIDCYQKMSNEAVQMHGGMGITDEVDIGLFLKRSRVCNQILGDSSFHRERFATLCGY